MLELWAIFEDDPGAPNFASLLVDGPMLEGRSADAVFEAAARAGKLLGRPLRSMWTIDPASEQGRVAIKAYGPQGYIAVPTTPETVWREKPRIR
jgi:hypothetical protein